MKFFERLRKFFQAPTSWMLLGTSAYSVYRLAQQYPGITNESTLRDWMKKLCSQGGEIATLTDTTIDDKIVAAALDIIEDDDGWSYLYGLMIRAGSIAEIPKKYDRPENAMLIISAIGLLVNLIQKIRESRHDSEVFACCSVAARREG